MPSFEASKHMVSNGEYLEFVKDAGYARQELWTDVGWRWKMFRNVKKPHFWVSEVGQARRCVFFFVLFFFSRESQSEEALRPRCLALSGFLWCCSPLALAHTDATPAQLLRQHQRPQR